MPKRTGYLHGYSRHEQDRLVHQARFLEPTIYEQLDFSGRRHLLEVGCGVGAQTEILLRRYPRLKVTGIDRSRTQIERARERLRAPIRSGRVTFTEADATDLPFPARTFDSAFICWFLEHATNPALALRETRRVLKPGGLLHATEVLNSSLVLCPACPATMEFWSAFNAHQRSLSGDPDAGVRLGNWLVHSGFKKIETWVRSHHSDDRDPKGRARLIDFWTPLLLSGAPGLLEARKISRSLPGQMVRELKSFAKTRGAIFFYNVVQARALA